MASLTLQGVRKSFGAAEILHGIDLEVADGEIVVLVGPSGCGKSTLLRLIAGLERISEGEFLMDGRRMNDVPPAKRGIGMVFQSYALYPHMTVWENISFGLRLKKTDRKIVEGRVAEVAGMLQLEELLRRKPRQLSGGQRQRVAIGRALVQQPEVFLFDEPLSNLDAKLRVSMRVEITKLHKKLRSTMVYVTHDQVEALTLANRIVVMNAGVVEQIGSPLDLYHRPGNLFVAGFIGSPKMNFIQGRLQETNGRFAKVLTDPGFEVTAHVDSSRRRVGSKVTVGIRPEHVSEGGARGNVFRGVVEVAEHLGELTYLYMAIDQLPELFVVKVEGTARSRDGQEIEVSFQPGDCYLFDENGVAFPRIDVEPDPAARATPVTMHSSV